MIDKAIISNFLDSDNFQEFFCWEIIRNFSPFFRNVFNKRTISKRGKTLAMKDYSNVKKHEYKMFEFLSFIVIHFTDLDKNNVATDVTSYLAVKAQETLIENHRDWIDKELFWKDLKENYLLSISGDWANLIDSVDLSNEYLKKMYDACCEWSYKPTIIITTKYLKYKIQSLGIQCLSDIPTHEKISLGDTSPFKWKHAQKWYTDVYLGKIPVIDSEYCKQWTLFMLNENTFDVAVTENLEWYEPIKIDWISTWFFTKPLIEEVASKKNWMIS